MRKILATILSICAFTAFAMPKTADFRAFAAQAQTPAQNITASLTVKKAQTQKAAQTQLLSPNTYEEYLSLSAPTDVAVCNDFTAISDGNCIYVYDRVDGVYRKYTHGDNSPQNKVTKLQFDSENNLYFLDAATALYKLDPMRLDEKDVTAEKTELVCSTFAINGNKLYFTNTSGNKSQISSAPLNNLKFSAATTHVENLTLTPALTFYKNELYYTTSGQYLNKIPTNGTGKETFVCKFDHELLALTVIEDIVYFATADGEFYAYDLNELVENKQIDEIKPISKYTGGYSALSTHGNYAYLIKKKNVVQYSLTDGEFTPYEIAGASSAEHRLNGAKDITLVGNKIFIADVSNKRVSVYDTQEKEFSAPLSTNFSAQYISADNDTVLLANATEVILYSMQKNSYGEQLSVSQRLDGNLVGVTNVYGTYYLVTDKNRFYTISKNTQTSEWEWATAQKTSTQSPSLLTSDIYGNLYVACGASVYTYTESTFATTNVSTKAVLTDLPANTTKILADYRSNIYALSENQLHKFNAPAKKNGTYSKGEFTSLNDALVYGNSSAVQSVALSIQTNAAYVLYKGNFLAVTDKLQLPTMQNIPVDGADTDIFNNAKNNFTVIKTKENAVLIAFDLNALQDAEVFPYLSYKRNTQSINALKIGTVDVYNLIAVYNASKAKYETFLVYADACQEYKTEAYKTTYTKEEQFSRYVSSNAALYKIPYADPTFATTDIPRGDSVTILGEIKKLDRDYYYVSYKNAKGETKTGYLPKAYATNTVGEPENEYLTFGDGETRKGDIGRMAYILVAFASICLLVDYLLLRKPREDDDDETEEETQS